MVTKSHTQAHTQLHGWRWQSSLCVKDLAWLTSLLFSLHWLLCRQGSDWSTRHWEMTYRHKHRRSTAGLQASSIWRCEWCAGFQLILCSDWDKEAGSPSVSCCTEQRWQCCSEKKEWSGTWFCHGFGKHDLGKFRKVTFWFCQKLTYLITAVIVSPNSISFQVSILLLLWLLAH